MTDFTLKLAGLKIAVCANFETTERFCKKYITDNGDTEFTVTATHEEIVASRELDPHAVTENYAETICIYRAIAERLPDYDRAVFHGAAITYKDHAYLFTAPSGTGKSTHIKLWREHIGHDVDIVNGDKPILHMTEDGATVFGTPWSGKENWNKDRSAPLAAICIVRQGKENRIEKISGGDALKAIMKQIYLPRDKAAFMKTVELIDRLLRKTPVYVLDCDISKEAVKTSFEAMTGETL